MIPKPLEYIIIRMGVPLALAALGISLMTTGWFYSGVVLLYMGLLLFAVDVSTNSTVPAN